MRTFLRFLQVFTIISLLQAADSPTNTPLRIVAYNIHHGAGMDKKMDLERIAKVLQNARPQLIALQEVDQICTRSGKVDTAKVLANALKMDHRFGHFMEYQGGQYGLAILSSLPITKTIRHPLPEGAEPRCALEVQVTVPGLDTPLSFVCIHNDWTQEAIRVEQIKALLAALADRPHPIILAGDFNGKPEGASIRRCSEAGFTRLVKDGPRFTFPSQTPKVEIDYIMHRGLTPLKTRHRVLDEEIASDHRPIFAELQLLPHP